MSDWFDLHPPPAPPRATTQPPPPLIGTGPKPPANLAGDAQGLIQWAQQTYGLLANNPAAMATLVKVLRENGFPNAQQANHLGSPSTDKIDFGNGQSSDVISNVDSPNAAWAWQPYATNGGGNAGAAGIGNIGSLLEAFPGEFASVQGKFPKLDIPEFAMPTGQEVLNEDPGYVFRVGQGEQALTQGRTAQGTAYTGGTLKDILNYGQAAASQEFGNAVARRQTRWGLNRDRLMANYDAAYKNYLDQYNMFRQRQQDTNQYLTDQQRIGIQANQ